MLRNFILSAFAVFLSCLTILAASQSARAETTASRQSSPNIVLILSDDMGYGDVNVYAPGVGVPTPNLDKLASQGLRFTQYYSAAPICSPSRAALLTGKFPSEVRLNSYLQTRAGNRNCEQDDYLDPRLNTLPRTLQKAGYATALIGKWHLGGGRDVDNAPKIGEYGFDEAISTWESPEPYPALGVEFAPWDRRMKPGQVKREDRTAYMVDKTLSFLERNTTQPRFVWLAPDDVHTPHRPGDKMLEKYGGGVDEKKTPLKNYRGVLETYDRQMGRLMDGIDKLGLTSNTLVIFTADNGPEPHFDNARTGGLRGMKLSLYEGGIREPFIVRWPGHVPAGQVDSKTVLCGIDMFPTLCAAAGIAAPAEGVNGRNLLAALKGKPVEREGHLLWEYGRKQEGYGRPGREPDRSPNVAIREGKWKLLINADGTDKELYDILADQNETTNLADQETTVTEKLAAQSLAWRKLLPPRSMP